MTEIKDNIENCASMQLISDASLNVLFDKINKDILCCYEFQLNFI